MVWPFNRKKQEQEVFSREITENSKESDREQPRSSRELPQKPEITLNDRGEAFESSLEKFQELIKAIKNDPDRKAVVDLRIQTRLLETLENLGTWTERNSLVLENYGTLLENLPDNVVTKLRAVKHKLDQKGVEPPKELTQVIHEIDQKRRSRELLEILQKHKSMTYKQLQKEMRGNLSYSRVTALVSEMIRDGVPLERRGRPVEVRLSL